MIKSICIKCCGEIVSWETEIDIRHSTLDVGESCSFEGVVIERKSLTTAFITMPSLEGEGYERTSGAVLAAKNAELEERVSQYEKILSNMARASARGFKGDE
jgi:hypothetical protein